MSQAFFIKNLVTQVAEPLNPAPWEQGYVDPPDIFKSEYANPATDSVFFSLVEGSYEHGRVVRLSNPASRIHGFVADFDGVTTIEDALLQIEGKHPTLKPYKGSHRPWAIGESLGGGQKMVWLFEKPVSTGGSTELADAFLTLLAADLQAKRFNCYDTTSSESIRYQHVGKNWRLVPGATRVPADHLFGLLGKAIDKCRRHLKTEYNVPLEAVNEEVHKHWPDAPRIEVGAMCSLFWLPDDEAGKTRAAQVRETGIACFSERAGVKFVSWKELFSTVNPEFVKQYADRKLGEVIESFYFDGKYFYGKIGGAEGDAWASMNWEQVLVRLKNRGLSSEVPKGSTTSEVLLARETIEDFRKIEAAGPFLFHTNETVKIEGKLFLNLTRRLPSWTSIEPDDSLDPERDFPFIWKLVKEMWQPTPDSNGQLPGDYLEKWLRRDIHAIVAGQGLGVSHALIIAGAAGTGKTFLAKCLLQRIFGWMVDAEPFLRGETRFNADLVSSPLWVMDDPAQAKREEVRSTILSKIKQVLVSGVVRVEEKFMSAANLPIRPRIVLLANDDVHSSTVIPSLNDSTRDKFAFLLVDPAFNPGFSSDPKENEARVAREFPHFVAWMLATKNPEANLSDREELRWGFRAYQNPTLVEATHESGYKATAEEIILTVLTFLHKVHSNVDTGSKSKAGDTLSGPTAYGDRDGDLVVFRTQDLALCLEQDHLAMGISARTVRDFGSVSLGRHLSSLVGQVQRDADRMDREPWLRSLPKDKRGTKFGLRLDLMPNDLVNPRDPF